MPKHVPTKNSATKRAPPAILSSTSDEECQEPCPKRPRDSAQRPPTRPESSSSSSENLSPSASPTVTQEAPSRGRTANRGGTKSSKGRPRSSSLSSDIEDKLIEFYRQNTCLYDLEHPNYKDKNIKEGLIKSISHELGVDSQEIIKWYNTHRRYYTQYVMKSSSASGSAGGKKSEQYIWCSQNFSFLEGHIRPTTTRDQLGSGIGCRTIPSDGVEDSDEDTQDSQISQPSANEGRRRSATKRLEDALVSGINTMSETGHRIASSLSAPTSTTSSQPASDHLQDFLSSIWKASIHWNEKEKRLLQHKIQQLFFDMAEGREAQQQPVPVATPLQHTVHQPATSMMYGSNQYQVQPPPSLDTNLAGPSWLYPHVQQQSHPVQHGPTVVTQYEQSMAMPLGPRQQLHQYHQLTPVTVAMPTPGWIHQAQPQQAPVVQAVRHTPVEQIQTPTAPAVQLPLQPTSSGPSSPLDTSRENSFSLTRMVDEHIDKMQQQENE